MLDRIPSDHSNQREIDNYVQIIYHFTWVDLTSLNMLILHFVLSAGICLGLLSCGDMISCRLGSTYQASKPVNGHSCLRM